MASAGLCSAVAEKWQKSFARLNHNEPGITGLLSFSEAWTFAKDFLRLRDIDEPSPRETANMQVVRAAFERLSQRKMLGALLDEFLEEMRWKLPLITKDVENFMTEYDASSDPIYIAGCVSRLLTWHKAWSPIQELGPTVLTGFTTAFQTHIFSILPGSFSKGFKDLVSATLDAEYSANPPTWMATLFEPADPTLMRWDQPLWLAFEQLGMIERYESLISSVCYEHIENHILATCAQVWDKPSLAAMRAWMTQQIVPWLIMPYARGARNAEEARTMLQGIGSRLDFHVCKTLADLRTREIFDIIIDFPDSRKALDDLKECLYRVDQRTQLVQSLRKANARRLLHPGADTKLILQQYVSIIRCLRIIDPPGVLLFKVADPIRRYLRDRPDTIRCIVASLVGDSESGDSLVDENEPIQPLQQAQVDDYSDPSWEPEPIDAGPDFRTNKPSDIISTLVSIYDSQELFVKELQVLLAQRLLAIKDGNFERERRNIEVLKIRFGEPALQVCEVMLRDMTESKRINQHIQSQKNERTAQMHPTIISRHFWPALQTSTFKMPGQFKEVQEAYAKEYSTFKPDKKLVWMSHLGTINLEVELDDRTVVADVPPLEAALIELFSQKDDWSVQDLMTSVAQVERPSIVKALATWVDLGVIKEDSPNNFRLLNVAEETGDAGSSRAKHPVVAAEAAPPLLTLQQQQADQMRVFWKFIEGMLKNLGTLPLDRIQQMLKFAPGYNRTIEQLASFMEAARREGLVTVKDGMWKLQAQ